MMCTKILAVIMVALLMGTIVESEKGPKNTPRLFSMALCLSREHQAIK